MPWVLHEEGAYLLLCRRGRSDAVREGPCEWQFHIQRVEGAYLSCALVLSPHVLGKESIILLIETLRGGVDHN